jgi:hypothetical protein
MTALKFAFVFFVAACGGSKSNQPDTTTGGGGTGGGDEATVDPTIPSWSPASCAGYQKAVSQAIACDAMDQGERDQIQATYDQDSASWKAEQDATPERIAEVESDCTTKTDAIRTSLEGKCGPATEAP